jgi:hypothetical protein
MSSLELLKCLVNYKDWTPPDTPIVGITLHEFDDASKITIQWIDHKLTQELFDKSLEMVEPRGGLLFLHCNYNNAFAKDESSLNLSSEQAEVLLTKVDKVLIGHEHVSSIHFDGRLILTGNIHPTSFSDISDKYIWYVDQFLGITKELVWSKEKYVKHTYGEDLQGDYEFIEVVGQVDSNELPAVARYVANLWKSQPSAYMIKNAVTSNKVEVKVEQDRVVDTLGTITNELKDTKLFSLWNDYLEQL